MEEINVSSVYVLGVGTLEVRIIWDVYLKAGVEQVKEFGMYML